MENELFEIIHEDDALLVINKPAGLVCHPTKGDAYSSLISRARLYLGDTTQPRLINRLDRETSGVTLVAKNAAVSGELGRLWEKRTVRKEYLAIVKGHVRQAQGMIDEPLGKDEQSVVAIKDQVREGGAAARTEFAVICRFSRAEGDFSFLRVQPLTGRKHQIRIHLAHYGHPIVGDKLYGGDEDSYLAFVQGRLTASQREKLILANHALHAHRVHFSWGGREFFFQAKPEPCFSNFLEGRCDDFATTARLLAHAKGQTQ